MDTIFCEGSEGGIDEVVPRGGAIMINYMLVKNT